MNDGSALWLILTLAVLVLFSAFFSATETAYTSSSPVRLKTLAKTKKSARLAVRLSENYNKVLSTLLIGNNIVNISAASIATIVFTHYYGEIGVTLSTIVMTVVVLIFGEISPKTIAKEKPEAFAMFSACTISYKFNGASIDYTKIKSISIKDFPNHAPLVYPPLSQMFTEALKDLYTRQTRLQIVRDNGDLDLEGEITGYDLTPLAVQEDALSAQTRLTITVRFRYTNRVKPEEDTEQTVSAYREFDSNVMLQDVQDDLCDEIIDELVDQIYNATVANW